MGMMWKSLEKRKGRELTQAEVNGLARKLAEFCICGCERIDHRGGTHMGLCWNKEKPQSRCNKSCSRFTRPKKDSLVSPVIPTAAELRPSARLKTGLIDLTDAFGDA